MCSYISTQNETQSFKMLVIGGGKKIGNYEANFSI